MPRTGPAICDWCGLDRPGAAQPAQVCAACRMVPPHFARARAPWQYAGVAQDVIRRFKYQRHWRLGWWLAMEMARMAQAAFPLTDLAAIAPVPSHWFTRRITSVRAAEQLARWVARALERPYTPHLLRQVRWTRPQTRLSWRARVLNVRGAFAAQTRLARDRGVLLIDDVLTSGATTNACALALRAAGATQVFVLTAARTPAP
jgi:predicted amidophosphoribosyltransferase